MTSASPRSQYESTVAVNRRLCREHYLLDVHLPEFPPTAPGQFIQIACRDLEIGDSPSPESEWSQEKPLILTGEELSGPLALIRRPFSLAGRIDKSDGVHLQLIHRVVGVGTDWLGDLKVDDTVGIIGPLGNRFTLPNPGQPAILVGGGVGIPPMIYLAQALSGFSALAICGVTTADLLPLTRLAPPDIEPTLCIQEFANHGIPSLIATDDGSLGMKGYVTQALERYLDKLPTPPPGTLGEGRGEGLLPSGINPIIYTCGPEIMMKRVAAIAMERGLECQVAVERAMACGMGTCQSCVIRVKTSGRTDGRTWVYRLACTDGPIFRGGDLLW